jgi:uncharacterized protein
MLYGLNVDWREVRWREISFLLSGRVVGATAAGALTMSLSDPHLIGLYVGLCVLAGVGLSLTRLRLPVTPWPLAVAGSLSGFMATLTSVGAPPIALLYQHQAVAHTRATLNAYFLFGALISLVVLLGYGLIRPPSVVLFGSLLPAMGLGVVAGDLLLRRTVITTLRPLTLVVAVLASSALITRSLL